MRNIDAAKYASFVLLFLVFTLGGIVLGAYLITTGHTFWGLSSIVLSFWAFVFACAKQQ